MDATWQCCCDELWIAALYSKKTRSRYSSPALVRPPKGSSRREAGVVRKAAPQGNTGPCSIR